jgi:hypothetical protein
MSIQINNCEYIDELLYEVSFEKISIDEEVTICGRKDPRGIKITMMYGLGPKKHKCLYIKMDEQTASGFYDILGGLLEPIETNQS